MLPPDLETSNALSGNKSKSQFWSQVSPSKQRWRHSHPPTRSHWDGQCGFCPHLPCLQMLQFPSQGQGSGGGTIPQAAVGQHCCSQPYPSQLQTSYTFLLPLGAEAGQAAWATGTSKHLAASQSAGAPCAGWWEPCRDKGASSVPDLSPYRQTPASSPECRAGTSEGCHPPLAQAP